MRNSKCCFYEYQKACWKSQHAFWDKIKLNLSTKKMDGEIREKELLGLRKMEICM